MFLLVCVLFAVQVSAQHKVIAYITNNGDDPTASQVRALTHMNFCFLVPDGIEGEIQLNFNRSRMKKLVSYAKLYDVKALIAFGGGGIVLTSELVENESRRHKLISNMVQFVEDNDLDGIDFDWEPDWDDYGGTPEGEQIRYRNNVCFRENFNRMIIEIRDSLDARFGEGNKLLSAAVNTDNLVYYHYYGAQVAWPFGYWEYLDFVNLMSYGNGGGGLRHGDYESVFGNYGAVTYWENEGMPLEKMVIGVPFYAAASWELPHVNYSRVVNAFPDLDSTVDTVRCDFGEGEYLYGFNSIRSLKEKVDKANELGMYGVMFWELAHDIDVEHPLSLLRALSPPPENPVEVARDFDTIFTTATFTESIDLSHYFSSSLGDMTFSVNKTPTRHSCEIVGDTLILTGDGIEDVGITEVEIRATSSLSHLDFVLNTAVIVVDSRPVLMAESKGESENLVLSDCWSLIKSNDPYMVPVDQDQLYTQTPEGDTVIHFIGTVKHIPDWNHIAIDFEQDDLVDLNRTAVVVEYKSDVEGAGVTMSATFVDTGDVLHSYTLRMSPGEWLCDTITPDKLSPGWHQAQEIDYHNIKKISIEIGGMNSSEVYNFYLKNVALDGSTTGLNNQIRSSLNSCKVSLKNNHLQFHAKVTRPHDVNVFTLNGQMVWGSTLIPGNDVHSFALPLARGIYVAQISGNEIKATWKMGIR